MNTKNIFRIAVIVVVLGVIGLIVWSGTHSPSNSGTSQMTPFVTPTVPSVTYGTPGNDWQTYSSASLGFKVAYPKDWVESSCGVDCVAFAKTSAPDQLITGVSVSPDNIANIASEAKPYTLASAQVTFNGIKWLRLTLLQPTTNEVFTSHFTAKSGKMYEFGINTTDATELDIYGRMVQSFVFLKK